MGVCVCDCYLCVSVCLFMSSCVGCLCVRVPVCAWVYVLLHVCVCLSVSVRVSAFVRVCLCVCVRVCVHIWGHKSVPKYELNWTIICRETFSASFYFLYFYDVFTNNVYC